MFKCDFCNQEKEKSEFRRYIKNPLCTECFNKENKEKRRLNNPKDCCSKCGVSNNLVEFVKNTNCCKECKKNYQNEYYENNKSSWVEYNNKSINSTDRKNKQKEYVEKNKDKISEYQKNYREKNKEIIKERRKEYQKNVRYPRHLERMKTDDKYKATRVYISLLKNFIKRSKSGYVKKENTKGLLGYSLIEFKTHIESLFLPGMTWFNHGEWHIDHIKPLSSFELGTPSQVVNSLDNLQPLWALENLRKSNK